MREQISIVDKIGGAGSKDECSVTANVERMAADGDLSVVVVSGPGGPAGRVTELALQAVKQMGLGKDPAPQFDEIQQRLEAHAEPHGGKAVRVANETAAEMETGLYDGRGSGWVVMGPERYMSGVYDHLLNAAGRSTCLVNPTAWLRRDAKGALDLEVSARGLARQLDPTTLNILAGTPGVDSDLRTMTVTPELRGYSDPTGMVAAHALQQILKGQSVMYRIIKDDVPGILRMPPGLGRDPAIAPRLNVVEAETLSAAGNNVVHTSVLELLQQSDIQLLVCAGGPNTADGTIIERNRPISAGERIAGIAIQQAVSYSVKDIKMEHRAGVAGTIINAFSDHEVPLINVVTGGGIVTAYVSASSHAAIKDKIPAIFEREYGDTFSLTGDEEDGLSIVTLVGEAMARDLRLRAEIEHQALSIGYDNDIRIDTSWASPSSNAVYVTMPTTEVERYAVTAYDHFFGST